jgi:hypothetical protein
MFSQKKYILAISRKTISFFKNTSGKNNKEEKILEKEWTLLELPEILKDLKKQFKFSTLRVLLGDDISYELILTFKHDEFDKSTNKRGLVFSRIKELIPEILTNDEWDFKEEPSEGKTEVQIKVFAPVKQFLIQIEKAASTNKIKIEVIESIADATLRNPDPVKSISEKKDLSGKDEDILNIQPPIDLKFVSEHEATPSNNEEKVEIMTITIVILVIFICLIIGIFIYLKNQNAQKTLGGKLEKKITPTKIVKRKITPTNIASPSAKIDKSKLSLQILNGNGTPGESAKMEEFLKTKGYSTFETGNADSFDYAKTEISVKKNDLFSILKNDLKNNYEIATSSGTLLSNDKFDATIIIGKK